MTNPTPAKWEGEFLDCYRNAELLPDDTKGIRQMTDFIHQLLSDYKSRLLSEVEGMKSEHKHDENCAEDEEMCNEMDDLMESRNQALSSVLALISKENPPQQ